MFATKLPVTYDSLLDFLVEKATPEEILAFTASAKLDFAHLNSKFSAQGEQPMLFSGAFHFGALSFEN